MGIRLEVDLLSPNHPAEKTGRSQARKLSLHSAGPGSHGTNDVVQVAGLVRTAVQESEDREPRLTK